MIGPNEVTIGRAGWVSPVRFQTAPPTMSWRTDGPGTFDVTLDTRAVELAGLSLTDRDMPLKGRWLWYEHPTAGAWGGVITRTQIDGSLVAVTAEQFAVLLRKRRMASTYPVMAISPGSLALHLLAAADRQGETFQLTGWTAQEGGKAVDIEPRGGDLCDEVIPELAAYGYQWRVRSDAPTERVFQFQKRLGEDKRGRVLLSEGVHLVRASVSGDLWTVANSIEGIPGAEFWEGAAGYTRDNRASIRALGRRYEETVAYAGVVTRSTIVPLVERELAERAYPPEVATFDVVDAGMCWREFREGDTISIASRHANVRCPMEVDLRTLDVGSGILGIAGRLLVEEAS